MNKMTGLNKVFIPLIYFRWRLKEYHAIYRSYILDDCNLWINTGESWECISMFELFFYIFVQNSNEFFGEEWNANGSLSYCFLHFFFLPGITVLLLIAHFLCLLISLFGIWMVKQCQKIDGFSSCKIRRCTLEGKVQ